MIFQLILPHVLLSIATFAEDLFESKRRGRIIVAPSANENSLKQPWQAHKYNRRGKESDRNAHFLTLVIFVIFPMFTFRQFHFSHNIVTVNRSIYLDWILQRSGTNCSKRRKGTISGTDSAEHNFKAVSKRPECDGVSDCRRVGGDWKKSNETRRIFESNSLDRQWKTIYFCSFAFGKQ